MNERDLATRLSARELACLRHLERYPDSELPQFNEEMLERLALQGLVDRVPLTVFPVLPQRHRYRLTARGRAMLAAAARER